MPYNDFMIQVPQEQLEELCRKFEVKSLYLFGSAATSRFEPKTSDADFLVEFHPSSNLTASDQYFGLLEALETLLRRRVDLVVRRAVQNPYFLESAQAGQVMLYAA